MSNENYKIMYEHAINANIKLSDENKYLKLDNEKLIEKINKAIKYAKDYCIDDEFYINLSSILQD